MSDELQYLLFFAGIFLLTAATVLGVGAFEYEVKLLGTAAEAPADAEGFVQYDRLEGRDKEVVGRAIDGERFVFRDPSDLPGDRQTRGKLAVSRDGRYYVLSRRLFFNWRTRFGQASILLGAAGLVAISESIRRHHFPHRSVFWTRR